MYRLQQHQVHLELCVSLFLRPEIERNRGNFIHHRISQSIASQVHRLDVVPSVIAAFHAHMFELLRRIDRKFRVVLFSASRTNDSPELPLAQTERTHQRALSTVSQWPQNAHSRFARAEGTQTRRGPGLPLHFSLPDEFRVGLEKRPREEFLVSVSFVFTSNDRKSISCPKGTQQLALAVRSLIPQLTSCCRNRAGTDSRDQGQESRKAFDNLRRQGLCERSALLLTLYRFLGRTVRLALKTSDRHEEVQHLGGKRILSGQFFGPRNPPLAQAL